MGYIDFVQKIRKETENGKETIVPTIEYILAYSSDGFLGASLVQRLEETCRNQGFTYELIIDKHGLASKIKFKQQRASQEFDR